MVYISALISFKAADTVSQTTTIHMISFTFPKAPSLTVKSLPPYGKMSVLKKLGMYPLSFTNKEFCESLLLKFFWLCFALCEQLSA